MLEYLLDNVENIIAILVAISVFAILFTFMVPLIFPDQLKSRMKTVALERERMRARERKRLQEQQQDDGRTNLRNKQNNFTDSLVESLKLKSRLDDGSTEAKLNHAGIRSPGALSVFLAVRFGLPIIFGVLAAIYIYVIAPNTYKDPMIRFAIVIVISFLGFYLPSMYLSNRISKRQASIRNSWPDSLDLLLICVESGMSIENALKKVANEIGTSSIPLAEEFTLTNAELAYLPNRRTAYENLAKRTGLDVVKSVVTSLIQAEKYGTPLGMALRVLSQENRDLRMLAAEKKAASLPPKLTVPMIVFFLPCLFVMIATPAYITATTGQEAINEATEAVTEAR